jgi:hypothetical protein
MFDCRKGECGLCTVDVLQVDGVLDHRDVFLSDGQRAAGRKLCTCVSRAVSCAKAGQPETNLAAAAPRRAGEQPAPLPVLTIDVS